MEFQEDLWGLAGRERVCSVINALRRAPHQQLLQILSRDLPGEKSAAPNPSRETVADFFFVLPGFGWKDPGLKKGKMC